MMTLSKSISQGLVFLMLSLFLAACSQPDDPEPSRSNTTPSIEVPDVGVIDNPYNNGTNEECEFGGTYPNCDPDPEECEFGGTFPNCNPDPEECEFGGTFPNCNPDPEECEFGGTFPNCNPDPEECEFGGTFPNCNPDPEECEFGGTFPNCNPDPEECEFGGTFPNCNPDPEICDFENGSLADDACKTACPENDPDNVDPLCSAFCLEYNNHQVCANFCLEPGVSDVSNACSPSCTEDPNQTKCIENCALDNSPQYCNNICFSDQQFTFCKDMCVEDPNLDFCSLIKTCNEDPSQQKCLDQCKANSTLSYCSTVCNYFPESDFCINTDPSQFTLTLQAPKNFHFEWKIDDPEQVHFFVIANVGSKEIWRSSTSDSPIPYQNNYLDVEVPVFDENWLYATYTLYGCTDSPPGRLCVDIGEAELYKSTRMLKAIGYMKSTMDPVHTEQYFGRTVALSRDGSHMAVAASFVTQEHFQSEGGIHIYSRSESGNWEKDTILQSPSRVIDGLFGKALSFSADGQYLAIGAPGETVEGHEDSGAVYMYKKQNGTWIRMHRFTTEGRVKQRYGSSVSMSDDAKRLVVGAIGNYVAEGDSKNVFSFAEIIDLDFSDIENSNTTKLLGVYGSDSPDFERTGMGTAVSISGDGTRIVVSAPNSGFVYSYLRIENKWSLYGIKKPSSLIGGATRSAQFGSSVSLSGDGKTLAVGVVDASLGAQASGAAVVFVLQEAYCLTGVTPRPSNECNLWYLPSAEDNIEYIPESYFGPIIAGTGIGRGFDQKFGNVVRLNGDGTRLVVSAYHDSYDSYGANPPPEELEDASAQSGAVYVYDLISSSSNEWSRVAYLKAPNQGEGDQFGIGMDMTDDGEMIAVGANKESRASTALIQSGEEARLSDDDDSQSSGAVYLY